MGVVPGRVWGSNALGMVPHQRENTYEVNFPVRQERSRGSRSLSFLEVDNLEISAQNGLCSNVLLGASSLDRSVERRYERLLEQTGCVKQHRGQKSEGQLVLSCVK